MSRAHQINRARKSNKRKRYSRNVTRMNRAVLREQRRHFP